MRRSLCFGRRGLLALGLLGAARDPVATARQEKAAVPPGAAVNITVVPGAAPPPPLSFTLYERHGHVTPQKGKCTHTGGGLIDVATPSPDTIQVTMSGAVVANSEMKFDLEQCFEISFDDPKVKKAKVLVEGRVIGVLRGEKKGCAEYRDACRRCPGGAGGAGRRVRAGPPGLRLRQPVGQRPRRAEGGADRHRQVHPAPDLHHRCPHRECRVQAAVGRVRPRPGAGPAVDQLSRAVPRRQEGHVRFPGDRQGGAGHRRGGPAAGGEEAGSPARHCRRWRRSVRFVRVARPTPPAANRTT